MILHFAFESIFNYSTRAYMMERMLFYTQKMAAQLVPKTERIATSQSYRRMLELHRQTPEKDWLFLNIGAGLGSITHRAISDGMHAHRTLSVDLNHTFLVAGLLVEVKEGRMKPSMVGQLPLLQGDLTDERFLPRLKFTKNRSNPPSDLRSLINLTPLYKNVSAIFAERIFHLLPFDAQTSLAQRLAPLLSNKKGSMIFGREHGMQTTPGTYIMSSPSSPGCDVEIYCQTVQSWRKIWEDAFQHDTSGVDIDMQMKRGDSGHPKHYDIWWCIKRR